MFGYKLTTAQTVAGLGAVIALVLVLQRQDDQRRMPGYVHDLQSISTRLAEADRVGDREGAFVQMEAATALVQRMNKDPAPPEAKRYCVLAADHLLKATLDVHEGGSWQDRKRFEAAMQDCE